MKLLLIAITLDANHAPKHISFCCTLKHLIFHKPEQHKIPSYTAERILSFQHRNECLILHE
jgi:hypothetical protein